MKLLLISGLVTLFSPAWALLAQVQQPLADAPLICNRTVLSCHWDTSVDSCCSPKYGLVVFTLQWIPGYGPSQEFTIHGLWPDKCNGQRAPYQGCDRTRVTNDVASIVRSSDSDLYQLLQTYWPSFKANNNWFWSHEWNKHGTCVTTLQPTCFGPSYTKYQDVIAYFKQALDLHAEYDVYGDLNLAGVIPGATYNDRTIREALQKAYGVNVKLDCNRQGQISEVGLFFYVQGRDTYKITDTIQAGSCRGAVYYPKKYN